MSVDRILTTVLVSCAIGVSLASFSAPALAAECPTGSVEASCAPGWEVTARHYPTDLALGHAGMVQVEAFNVGAASSGPVTVTDTLPHGVTAIEAGDYPANLDVTDHLETARPGHQTWACTGNGHGAVPGVEGASVVTCTTAGLFGGAGIDQHDEIGIRVRAEEGALEDPQAADDNHVVISGGGAPSVASTRDPIPISSLPAPFEFTNFDVWFSNADGTLDTQAGSHPYAGTFSFDFSTVFENGILGNGDHEARNIEVLLPPGLVGNPSAVPECTRPDFLAKRCPGSSQVGTLRSDTFSLNFVLRVYNLVPPPGVPADFGFTLEGVNAFIEAGVRSGGDYGITAHTNNTPQKEVRRAILTLWGVPGDRSHDRWRNEKLEGCTTEQLEHPNPNGNFEEKQCAPTTFPRTTPFLTLPTACGSPLKFTIRATSWQHPEDPAIERSSEWHDSNNAPAGITGCDALGFNPMLTVSPDTTMADTPTGLSVEVKPPLGGLEEPGQLGTSDIQGTTVTLPAGLVVNPGQAAGLQACRLPEDGLTTSVEEAKGEEDNGSPSCPEASRVGTAKAKSPLLEGAAEKELEGKVYVLDSNPPHLKLLAALSADGVNVKLVLNADLNEQTGEITTTVANVPQFPVSDFELHFDGGAKAALDTPAQCGNYQTTSDFTPWGSPFVADSSPTSAFAISADSGGGVCPSTPLPFSPTMTAGSTSTQAGAFTDFSLLLQRDDGQQRLERLQFKEPAGLAGLISEVPLCPEPQASQGTCDSASHIGHAIVTSGPGNNPLVLPQPGAPELPIYLTGPYKGAPFGLSIVTPVIAGPFNLGTIVTRAAIAVDPDTAQITITADPLPQIVDGVPTDLRSIDSIIDRPQFLFNPTNCTPAEFTGTATSAGGGATAPISSRFAVGSCRDLEFHPSFAASTQGNGSFNRNGASLTVKIGSKQGPSSNTEANIAKVDVSLPVALPSRLSTLQKACTETQFARNPTGCPVASKVGTAVARTPVLPVALKGTAYLVSHGGAAFPDLVMILEGDGVTIDLVGNTQIKKGITSSRFETVPDAPISSFELNLPEGPFSALAANKNLCEPTGTVTTTKKVTRRVHGRLRRVTVRTRKATTAALVMPTTITGQNGAVVQQSTRVAVTGCSLARAKKKVKKKAKGRTRGRK
jgi:hypothetical protein